MICWKSTKEESFDVATTGFFTAQINSAKAPKGVTYSNASQDLNKLILHSLTDALHVIKTLH